jgi:uncharacterized membrane protein YqjE
MAEEASGHRKPTGRAGLFGNLLALASALTEFLESRLALIAQESRTALVQVVLLAVCLIAALMLFGFGYAFLIASAIVALAHLTAISWVWLALAAAGVHFLIALIFLLIARSRMTRPLFPATAAELKQDRQWLKNLETTSRPTN